MCGPPSDVADFAVELDDGGYTVESGEDEALLDAALEAIELSALSGRLLPDEWQEAAEEVIERGGYDLGSLAEFGSVSFPAGNVERAIAVVVQRRHSGYWRKARVRHAVNLAVRARRVPSRREPRRFRARRREHRRSFRRARARSPGRRASDDDPSAEVGTATEVAA